MGAWKKARHDGARNILVRLRKAAGLREGKVLHGSACHKACDELNRRVLTDGTATAEVEYRGCREQALKDGECPTAGASSGDRERVRQLHAAASEFKPRTALRRQLLASRSDGVVARLLREREKAEVRGLVKGRYLGLPFTVCCR